VDRWPPAPHRRRGKNWLFAGSFEGARRAALLYSLVQSRKLVDVSPFDYLKEEGCIAVRMQPDFHHGLLVRLCQIATRKSA
jgi:hypothetical protein